MIPMADKTTTRKVCWDIIFMINLPINEPTIATANRIGIYQ